MTADEPRTITRITHTNRGAGSRTSEGPVCRMPGRALGVSYRMSRARCSVFKESDGYLIQFCALEAGLIMSAPGH